MNSYVSKELRPLVANRADHLCELLPDSRERYVLWLRDRSHRQPQTFRPYGGREPGFRMCFLQSNKGSDIGSMSMAGTELVRFFNPRTDHWAHHFLLNEAVIEPRTSIGEATARILKFNEGERVLERETLIAFNRYPPALASSRMLG